MFHFVVLVQVAFFDTKKAGELTSHLSSDVPIVTAVLGIKTVNLLQYTATFISRCVCIVMLGLCFCCVFCLALLCLWSWDYVIFGNFFLSACSLRLWLYTNIFGGLCVRLFVCLLFGAPLFWTLL